MPTVGWIFEGDVERFLSATTQVCGPSGPLAERFTCPFCTTSFASSRELNGHLQKHAGERPLLLLGGQEPSSLDVIRRRVPPEGIQFLNCTSIRQQFGTGDGREITFKAAAGLLSSRHARVRLELLNQFEPSASPISQAYDLDIQAPTDQQIEVVDRSFVRLLGRPDPTIAIVDEFLNTAESCAAREYAGALGLYVIAILVKDGDVRSGISNRQRDYRPKLNGALRVLQNFDRPLPRLISSLIRLSSNDVFTRHPRTGHEGLDTTLDLLCGICVSSQGSFGAAADDTPRAMVPVCPIDNGTDMVINRAIQLRNTHRFGRTLHERLTSELELTHVDPFDRVKLCVLWAVRAMELNKPEAAIMPLREIAGDAAFGVWAQERLDQIDR